MDLTFFTQLSIILGMSKSESGYIITTRKYQVKRITCGSLNTLPRRRNLDEDTLLGDANRLVKGNELLGLGLGGLLVEGETGIDLSRDTTRDDLENLLAELDELKDWGRVAMSTGDRNLRSDKRICRRQANGYLQGGPWQH